MSAKDAKTAKSDQPTPMMAQFLAIKAEVPDCLLFYRMGDFYELFFDDAVAAAEALDITLTKRGKHEGRDIPMCGVPVHSAETYLSRLIRKGFRVAVCEQTEDPAEARKRRGHKAVVRREVIRLVTPGTITEEALLDAKSDTHLVALARAQGRLGLAWLDLASGAMQAMETREGELEADLARLAPTELLVADALVETEVLAPALAPWIAARVPGEGPAFDSNQGARRLKAHFQVADLEAFGAFSRAEIAALGALLDYVLATQKGQVPRLDPPRRIDASGELRIDAATRRGLELTRTLSGAREGSLLATVDRTVSGPGARLLAAHLAAPLANAAAINRRLDMVGHFVEAVAARQAVRERLGRAPDLARALGRLAVERGGPRDLAAVADGLERAGDLARALPAEGLVPPPEGVRDSVAALGGHAGLVDLLRASLAPEVPAQTREGGFVAAGLRADLDEQRRLRDEGRRLILALEAKYRRETGIDGLKIRHNHVLGYFVEASARRADPLLAPPLDQTFLHRQSMANALRFSTSELVELERAMGEAAEQAQAIELEVFERLSIKILQGAAAIRRTAEAMAALDVAAANAELAANERYCRPQVDDSLDFEVRGGRHPVVEAAILARREGGFVANDCDLGPGSRLWLLTGPNMAGKSTFLRQNALICVLAQAGLWVPAASARLGVVDRLFSRIGASDDLASGRSTFMVEMVETAAILNQAGERSLVILDEIGRGTATWDGLAIAWAVVEHLAEVNRCRTLFATHYHELTALAGRLPSLANHTMRVSEWQGEVVFLHEVAAGAADRSYGIQVARLAGLPATALGRAETVLAALEKNDAEGGAATASLAEDLPLFAAARPSGGPTSSEVDDPAREALVALDPDQMSPREALDVLYRLKDLFGD